MIRRLVLALPLAALAGCLPSHLLGEKEKPATALVPANPLEAPPPVPPVAKASYPPGDGELALRVDFVGRKLLSANPDAGLRPLFATIGSPSPEIFHQGTHLVHVTEGLVKQCKSEAELAAVLALELGKMVADREVSTHPDARGPERLPPAEVPIGNAGQVTGQDRTNAVELALFEKARPRNARRLPRPNPRTLAQSYLEKAGYHKHDLDAVEPLLQSAERNYSVEKQFKAAAPARPGVAAPKWTPGR